MSKIMLVHQRILSILIAGWIYISAINQGTAEDPGAADELGNRIPEAHYASCAFEGSMCGWLNNIQQDSTPFYIEANVANVKVPPQGVCNELTEATKEVKGGGGYAHSLREQKMRYWKTVCDKRCYYLVQQSIGRAEIESPEFKVNDSTIVLQVNFSYWLENSNRTAQLQLLQVPTSGPNVGVPNRLWSSDEDLKHTDNWNATVINIIQPTSSKTLKLAFWGTIEALEDLIAIDRISVQELAKGNIFVPTDQMPKVSFKIELEGNPYVCPRNIATIMTICSTISNTLIAALFFYGFIYFR